MPDLMSLVTYFSDLFFEWLKNIDITITSWKCLEIAITGLKWVEMDGNSWKWLATAVMNGDGWKLLEMARNGW